MPNINASPENFHSGDPDIDGAVAWLRSVTGSPVEARRYIVPELRSRFGLSALQACDAIRLARKAVRS
jgi:hypothetical protein